MPTTAFQVFSSAKRLDPVYEPQLALQRDVNLAAAAPGTTYTLAQGTVLGELSASPGTFKAYSAAAVANPAAAPTGAVGTSGTLPAGTYNLFYSWVNANGQTQLSPVGAFTVAGSGSIAVNAVTPLPAGVASVNWFLSIVAGSSDVLLLTNNAGGAFTVTAVPAPGSALPPQANTAVASTDGSQIPKALLTYAVTVDANGNITYQGELGTTFLSCPAFMGGYFRAQELTGMDQNALSVMNATLLSGNLTSGILKF